MIFRNKTRYQVQLLGADVLRQVAAPVLAITDEIRQLAGAMALTMDAFEGIGLAAPQAGVSLRMVVLGVPAEAIGENPTPGEIELLPQMPLTMINPEIISRSESCGERSEGCLSVPDIFAPVVRPNVVVVRFQTLDGAMHTCECGGLLGRCIQHELDHLDGHLFIDRVVPEERTLIDSQLRRLEKFSSRHEHLRVTTR